MSSKKSKKPVRSFKPTASARAVPGDAKASSKPVAARGTKTAAGNVTSPATSTTKPSTAKPSTTKPVGARPPAAEPLRPTKTTATGTKAPATTTATGTKAPATTMATSTKAPATTATGTKAPGTKPADAAQATVTDKARPAARPMGSKSGNLRAPSTAQRGADVTASGVAGPAKAAASGAPTEAPAATLEAIAAKHTAHDAPTTPGTTTAVGVKVPALRARREALAARSGALPTTSEALPTTSEALSTTSEALSTTSEALPKTSEAPPTTSEALPTTSEALPKTSEALPTTSEAEASGTPVVSLPPRRVSARTASTIDTTASTTGSSAPTSSSSSSSTTSSSGTEAGAPESRRPAARARAERIEITSIDGTPIPELPSEAPPAATEPEASASRDTGPISSFPATDEGLYATEQTIDRLLRDVRTLSGDPAASGRVADAFTHLAEQLGGEVTPRDYYTREWGRSAARSRSEEVDDFGLDHAYDARSRTFFETLYRRWFRVATLGIDAVPSDGRVLLVANHGGSLPWDALMLKTAFALEHPRHRELRWLAEDVAFHTPFLGATINRLGAVRACPENAERLLERGKAVAVFPEGEKGTSKPFRRRYELQRFGRGGYVKLALRTRTPIVPVAVIGAEEAHPLLFRSATLGKLFGMAHLPFTPTFPWLGPVGLVPLPSRWSIVFGRPIDLSEEPDGAENDTVRVDQLNDEVRSAVQSLVQRALGERTSAYL